MAATKTTSPRDTEPTGALQSLLESTAILLATSDQETVLASILDLASKVLAADAYAVWRDAEGDGDWQAIAMRGLSPSYRTHVRARPTDAPTAIRAIPDLQSEPSLSASYDAWASEGIRAMLVVPLALSGPGTLTFYWRHIQAISQLDQDYAAALGNLCAAALNTVQLHQQNDREKHRLSFLAEASTVLASSLDYEATLQRVAHLAVPQIADWCTVHVVEKGAVHRLVVAHADPAMLRFAEDFSRRYPEEIREDRGLGAVLRHGHTEIVTHIDDAMLAAAARDPEHLEAVRSLQISSSILVPLSSRGRMLGAIRLLAAGSGRHFTPDDVQLAEDLARRAATAIENAQLHRAVLQQESELRLSHAAGRMGSWVWDLAHQTMSASPEFRTIYGVDPQAELSLELCQSMIHPEDRDRVLRGIWELFASTADQVTADHRVIAHDGRILWIHSRGTVQRDAAGKAISAAGISIDVTEARQAEAALRRTEKLAAAGRLAATVAHEVNNPLEALTNLVYLAATEPGLPPRAEGFLETAQSELARIAQIVRQTLGFYRDSATPRPTDLARLVAEATDLYRSRAEARAVKLILTAQPGLCVLANAGELRQVVANLLSNALDASPRNSSVELTVQTSGCNAELTIADHGAGIHEDHFPHLFEPFFTTKEEIGTGLGLWVSKGIVEKHHGTISASTCTVAGESGTIFTLLLPLVPQT